MLRRMVKLHRGRNSRDVEPNRARRRQPDEAAAGRIIDERRREEATADGARTATAPEAPTPSSSARVHRAVMVSTRARPRSSTVPDPPPRSSTGEATEMISRRGATECSTETVAPQVIPARTETQAPRTRRSWGWVIAVILVIAALVAVAVLGTVLLTRGYERRRRRRKTRSARRSRTSTSRSRRATWRRCEASPAATTGTATSSTTRAQWTETH